MTTRADQIDAVARLLNGDDRADRAVAWLLASSIVDRLLPQVTTLAELGALSPVAVLMDLADGETYHAGALGDLPSGEWAVVWQPSVDRVTT